jgi:hemerythrin
MTLLILWNHACNVGVKAMDDQHAIMMDTMNELRLVAIGGNKRRWVSA